MHGSTALLIGGDPSLQRTIREVVEPNRNLRLVEVPDIDAGVLKIRNTSIHMVLLYVADRRDQQGAVRFLRVAQRLCPRMPALIVHEEMESREVLRLLRHGATECLSRPLNISRLSLVLDMLAMRAAAPSVPWGAAIQNGGQAGSLDCGSTSIRALMDQVQRVAPLDTTILITGQTGTGKTRLSQIIHELSPRRAKKFVVVNCGALSPTLVESELFGHVRGAFTGADRDHPGKFTQAGDGTLLLDEIDTMSPEMQVKFLRVVEERVFEPVGSDRSEQLRARLIVATNKSLEEEVEAGRFRSDLFFRLNVIAFQIPPLRERREEIRPLAETFIEEFSRQHRLPRPELSAGALAALEAYDWPGNVRELRNTIERAVILAGGSTIDRTLLPAQLLGREHAEPAQWKTAAPSGTQSNKLASARSAAERSQLLDALRRNGNNRSRTAADLGISRVALYKRLHKFGML